MILRVSLACAVIALSAASLAKAQQQAPVPTVAVVTAQKQPVTEAQHYVGRVEAVDRVDVRARVTGYLEAVLFKEGDRVKTGDPLYRIEQPPFEAALAQAKATTERAQAQLDNANMQLQRAEELLKTNATSVAVRDDRLAAQKSAAGDLAAAEAAQKTTEINLGYTDIVAPIDGRIGRSVVTRGNVVGPDSGVLTTIVSVDPMYVIFPVSQRDLLQLREQRQGNLPKASDFKVIVQFSNGTTYPKAGTIDFVDVKVDRATDTIAVRASFPNPDGILVDGQLVQVSIEGDKPEERVLIPQTALIADQQGIYVYIVDNGKAAIRRLTLGQNRGANVIVNQGLSGGEQVVVGGFMNLKPGAPVNAAPVTRQPGG